MFTDLFFYAYVGIHQVRIPVFDSCRRCPRPSTIGLLVLLSLCLVNSRVWHWTCAMNIKSLFFPFFSRRWINGKWFVHIVTHNAFSNHKYQRCHRVRFHNWGDITNLKTVDTIGNCQRPVFSIAISEKRTKSRIGKNVPITTDRHLPFKVGQRTI